MHALLNTNTSDDVLFVQEPWFGHIGTTRDDKQREGREVLGGQVTPPGNFFTLTILTMNA